MHTVGDYKLLSDRTSLFGNNELLKASYYALGVLAFSGVLTRDESFVLSRCVGALQPCPTWLLLPESSTGVKAVTLSPRSSLCTDTQL